MHLVAASDMTVTSEFFVRDLELLKGQNIHTENSYKYTLEDFSALALTAGLRLEHSWLDDDELFSVHYLSAV